MKRLTLLFLVLVLLLSGNLLAQDAPVYRNLVLEGGGIRGVAYGGALEELEKRNVLQQIERVGGTSAGAIQACLLAVGYTAEEITAITFATPFQRFNDGRLFFAGGINRLVRQYGWYRGNAFSNWIGDLIKAKTGNADLTFAELHQLTGKGNYRDLYVTGTNLSKQQTVVFSHETYPNMKVRDAVRVSMSIPLYYRAVALDSAGNILTHPRKHPHADIVVDGGITANYPIDIFDHRRYLQQPGDPAAAPKDGYFFNRETIGIRVDSDAQIEYNYAKQGLAPYPITNFRDYIGAFYNIVIENLNRPLLKPEDWQRTISVSSSEFEPQVKKLSKEQKEQLLESGREGVRYFFDNKLFSQQ
ncbi:MAG: patatin-like phospholipase family protein [Hymenobacteraceae bacterium]|nr:patatin-like phospholipase family protein [Hymenobacteraceae bacterium]MDX5397801.1 patatin-like phospholipase family protein [Hymenobacteraceae bacterium]MDX5442708.1 patatin-like phospholipase family protein [Hymenobacteraceae bacterium]MDX5513880.1 patatin-like phospholipase family protein [Hymenobacteraceae bacterium]